MEITSALDWTQLFINLFIILSMVCSVLVFFYRFLEKRYAELDVRVSRVERFDVEFGVMKEKLSNVELGMNHISEELTGVATRIEKRMDRDLETVGRIFDAKIEGLRRP